MTVEVCFIYYMPHDGRAPTEFAMEENRVLHLHRFFESIGIAWRELPTSIQSRLEKLARETEIANDEEQAVQYADRLKDILTPSELRIVKQATVFTDIGKTGPLGETRREEDLITRIYKIDANFNPGKMTLVEFLSQFYPATVEKDMETIIGMGMDVHANMRSFFNMHADWTLELLMQSELPDDVIISASNHHFLEGVHPGEMVQSDGTIRFRFTHRPFDERDIFVILLDKYDARIRRGGVSHDAAMDWLTSYVATNETLKKFPEVLRTEFLTCIQQLNEALGSTARSEALAAK